MTSPKQPQDRKRKAAEAHPDEPFEFEHAGQSYELAAATEQLTVGYARTHRHLDQADQLFTMLEELADKKTLAAIDTMKAAEFKQFQKDFFAHIGVELGE